jgi:poly(A) polymerase
MFSTIQDYIFTHRDRISHLLTNHGCHGYIVGGLIRDMLLDRQTSDIDIAVDGNALNIAKNVAEEFDGKFVVLDRVNNIARVVIGEEAKQWHLDISSFSGDIESDLARRDFTINAMAVDLSDFDLNNPLKLVDPFSGREDLKNKVLRAVSDCIFEQDAARLLRAVRLAMELSLEVDQHTECLIRECSQYVTKVAGERVREELLRLLSLPRAAYNLRYLDSLGLLGALIPELMDGKEVEQPTVHFWDVFEHSLQTVATLEFVIRENDWPYSNGEMLDTVIWSEDIEGHLSREVSSGSNHRILLKIAALLHDVAKPKTKLVDDSGRARFFGHTMQGAAMVTGIMERLRFSGSETKLVEDMVKHHLHPVQMATEGLPTSRAIYRYFRDTGDSGIDILFLALADYLACLGHLVTMRGWRNHCRLISYIMEEHEKQQIKIHPVKLVNGHDLMEKFGLASGPLLGELLSMLYEAQASGDINNREEALALAEKELDKQRCATR